MNLRRSILTTALVLCAATPPAWSGDFACRAASGERTLPLVELYTSEGCDTCPPADRWVSRSLAPAPDMPASVLAFHVDYWNQLGWPDRFSAAAWSARQHDIARASRSPTVYTPQVLLQGRDFGEWRDAGALRDIAAAAKSPPRAAIAIDARSDGRHVVVAATARMVAVPDRAGARLVVAYTDGGHVTDVKRGENAGVRLSHEHVVRALATSGAADATGAFKLETSFEIPAEAGTHPRIVAFVERDARREVLQSVTLPLDRCSP